MPHDSKLWCEDCQKGYDGECVKHGPLTHVSDTEVGTRARISLPHILELKEGKLRTGIFAKQKLSKRLRFGPLHALLEKDPVKQIQAETEIKNRFGIIYKLVQEDNSLYLLDTRFEEQSNWMIFVRPAEKRSEQNLVAFQYRKELFFATSKEIPAQCELKVWFSSDYAQKIGAKLLPEESGAWQFRARHKFNCIGCGASFSSTANLRNHQCPKFRQKIKLSEPSSQPTKLKKISTEEIIAVTSAEVSSIGSLLGVSTEPSTSKKTVPKLKEKTTDIGVRAKKSAFKRSLFPSVGKSPKHEIKFEKGEEEPRPKEEKGVYLCSLCDKVFHSPGKLKQHSYSHTGERPFICPHCQKAFSSRFKLGRHQLIHTGERQHQCPLCSRSFHRKDHLKNHIQIHDPNKQFKCKKQDCGKEYNSYMSYRKHCAVHAAEDGDLECKICLEMFDNKEDLIGHLRVHVGTRSVKSPSEKKFQCDQCDRRFFTRKDVKRHMVVHTGKRDFICSLCPQKFGRKDHLVRHLKKSHGITDPARLDIYDPLSAPGPSSAPQAVSPEAATLSSASASSGEQTFSSLFPPEAMGDPLKSFVSPLQTPPVSVYCPGAFSSEFRFFEEGVKEEPELTASVESIGEGGDDISRMLGMYLPSASVSVTLPSMLHPIESVSPNLEPVGHQILPEGTLESIQIHSGDPEPPPLIPISPQAVYERTTTTLSTSHLLPVSRSSTVTEFASGHVAGYIDDPARTPLLLSSEGGGFSSLLEEDVGSSLPTHDPRTLHVTTTTTTTTSTTVSTTATTTITTMLPGFDQAFP